LLGLLGHLRLHEEEPRELWRELDGLGLDHRVDRLEQEARAEEEEEARDDEARERPVDGGAEPSADRRGEHGPRRRLRRRDELKEDRGVADGDLATALIGDLDLEVAAGVARAARGAEVVEALHATRQRDATRHAVGEVEDVVAADELEERE